jgi:hypothetical protein
MTQLKLLFLSRGNHQTPADTSDAAADCRCMNCLLLPIAELRARIQMPLEAARPPTGRVECATLEQDSNSRPGEHHDVQMYKLFRTPIQYYL